MLARPEFLGLLSGHIATPEPPPTIYLSNGIAAWFSLDEASGIRYDATTNAINLDDSGTVFQTNGVVSGAAWFTDGTSALTNYNCFDFTTNSWTIAGWFLLNDISSYQIFFGIEDSSTEIFLAQYNTDNTISALMAPAWQVATINYSFATETWYFMAVVYAASNSTASLIISGVDTNTPATFTWPANSAPLKVTMGMRPNGASPFLGALDEWAFWSRNLSLSEIETLSSGKSFPP